MDHQLLITTIGNLGSAALAAMFGAFVLWQNPKRLVNRTFALFTFIAAVYGVSFSVLINLPPSPSVYWLWMLCLLNLGINAFYLHFILAVTNQTEEARWVLRASYVVVIILVVAALIFPHAYIPNIEPKLFTKSFINAGPLYTIATNIFSLIFTVATFYLLRAYFRKGSNRRQLEYLILASIIGYSTGPLDIFLVYNIPVSPIFGIFYGLYLIPIAYGIANDNLLDIRVVIKRTFFYAVGIALTAGVLTAVVLLNNMLLTYVPGHQVWTVPTVAAAVAFILGRYVWLKSQEADRLKTEFITNAAHQLRTPLTAIKWSFDLLSGANLPENDRAILERGTLASADMQRIAEELMTVARTGGGKASFQFQTTPLAPILREAAAIIAPAAEKKQIEFQIDVPESLPQLRADAQHLGSAIQNLLDNAVRYTPSGGTVRLLAKASGPTVSIAVSDTGIGISKEDQARLFDRFFRGEKAIDLFANGSGLGLSIAKNVIDAHHGRITVDSVEGQGTTFTVTLPVVVQNAASVPVAEIATQ